MFRFIQAIEKLQVRGSCLALCYGKLQFADLVLCQPMELKFTRTGSSNHFLIGRSKFITS